MWNCLSIHQNIKYENKGNPFIREKCQFDIDLIASRLVFIDIFQIPVNIVHNLKRSRLCNSVSIIFLNFMFRGFSGWVLNFGVVVSTNTTSSVKSPFNLGFSSSDSCVSTNTPSSGESLFNFGFKFSFS